jgi:hypothetical protein
LTKYKFAIHPLQHRYLVELGKGNGFESIQQGVHLRFPGDEVVTAGSAGAAIGEGRLLRLD